MNTFPPTIFTIVFAHPDAESVVVSGVGMRQMWGVVLGAHPVREVVIVPAERGDDCRKAGEVLSRAKRWVFAERKTDTADLAVSFHSSLHEETPKWAQTTINGLDGSARKARQAVRAVKLVEAQRRQALHEAAGVERQRHARNALMYTIEQRARLVGEA